jgi:hypothetical protein
MTYETQWYLIDTDNFETASDVVTMIRDIQDEANALCHDCSKCRMCGEKANFPEDHPACLRRDEYRALAEVMGALRPYKAVLEDKEVA